MSHTRMKRGYQRRSGWADQASDLETTNFESADGSQTRRVIKWGRNDIMRPVIPPQTLVIRHELLVNC